MSVLVVRGVNRRRWAVLAELSAAVSICLLGYYVAAGWFREREAAVTVALLHLVGVDDVSGVLPGHILIFRSGGEVLDGEVTTSCSSILTVVALTALTIAVLRQRRLHALAGLLVALAAVVAVNDLRLVATVLAGLAWGRPAMIGFHDWVGTIWSLAATLGGFLLMVCVALPAAERAEQDVAGRHTARRPESWARPGLGYRPPDPSARPAGGRRSLTGLVHRWLLPRAWSRALAARREAGRIDYRIGHLDPADRAVRVQELVADGLGAHTATVLAVATYEQDVAVLDALAAAVAARQWEPVTNDRIVALRLWARGWLLGRRSADAAHPSAGPLDPAATLPLPRPRPRVPLPPPGVPTPAPPASFARPVPGAAPTTAEDER